MSSESDKPTRKSPEIRDLPKPTEELGDEEMKDIKGGLRDVKIEAITDAQIEAVTDAKGELMRDVKIEACRGSR